MIIVGEYADDFEQLRAELMEDFDPQSAIECELIERLAGISWRLRRVPFFEAAIVDARQAQLDHDARRKDYSNLPYKTPQEFDGGEDDAEEMPGEEWSVYMGHAFIQDVMGDGLGRLARHEASLVNAFTKTLQTLLLLQENRRATKGEPVMLEVVALPSAA